MLEAFSAGVPVLGANHGGIAELVRDGIDGILFAPSNVRALSDALTALATEPALLGSLRANVPRPRSDEAVVEDMMRVYDRLIGQRSQRMARV